MSCIREFYGCEWENEYDCGEGGNCPYYYDEEEYYGDAADYEYENQFDF